ncbi:MAG: 4Fe-4S dicluster domain-containing protein [Chloroflexi bacterium]|nr:4Fe-4S dicluster domain-containing protein [Chloroflexota bacterium]
MLRCTHCGMCLNACPTYRVLGWEMDSPRGRVYLMRGVAEGRYEVDAHFAQHMDACLACLACQTACPATVQFGQLVESARWQVTQHMPQSRLERFVRWLVFKQLFASNFKLRFAASLIRLYQQSGIQSLAHRLKLVPAKLRDSERLLPRLPSRFTPLGRIYPASGRQRGRVAMLSGCVMGTVYAPVNTATIRVLNRNGFEVVVPREQICCGALAAHAGERSTAKAMARRNIAAFAANPPFDAIIVNAAGCGVSMKEYGELLKDDPAWREPAAQFARQVQDVSEFLAARGIEPPTRAIRKRITYQDPCHLAHGQNVRSQPRQLLGAIPGLQIIEMRDSDRCCGSAGIYNITHPDIAMQVLDAKMANAGATQPEIIVTANAGCMLQLQLGVQRAGIKAEVMHVIELLDRAYETTEARHA